MSWIVNFGWFSFGLLTDICSQMVGRAPVIWRLCWSGPWLELKLIELWTQLHCEPQSLHVAPCLACSSHMLIGFMKEESQDECFWEKGRGFKASYCFVLNPRTSFLPDSIDQIIMVSPYSRGRELGFTCWWYAAYSGEMNRWCLFLNYPLYYFRGKASHRGVRLHKYEGLTSHCGQCWKVKMLNTCKWIGQHCRLDVSSREHSLNESVSVATS